MPKGYNLFILFICLSVTQVFGQVSKFLLKGYQIEAGITGSNYLYPYSKGLQFYDSRIPRKERLYIGLNKQLGKKTYLSVSYQRHLMADDRLPLQYPGIVEVNYGCINMGFGYRLLAKKHLQWGVLAQLSYRTRGYEILAIRPPPPFPIFEYVYIDHSTYWPTLGGLATTNLEYFFTRHIGIGANVSFHYYPFQRSGLNSSSYYLNPTLYDNHENNKRFVSVNLKLAYRFNLRKGD